ncbi:MAG TPA: carboxyltransferase domain-containing protein [Haliangiales bacterium]|nr:carboxyltransferase domain-containing protein [Haliangiales bacterium]
MADARQVIEPFGDAAWRLARPDGVAAAALLASLRACPGVVDVVVAERHVLVTFEPASSPDLEPALAAARGATASPAPPRRHVVRVRYDGEDLAAVAAATGLSVAGVIDAHVGRDHEVKLIGFLPGFAYLGDLDPRLVLPRRASPRPRVPAGAVALAGPYTGIYPFASPGGWHLVGTALGFRPFAPETGAALAVGDLVRFEPC